MLDTDTACDPEYTSVEAFIKYLREDERNEFSHVDLSRLVHHTGRATQAICRQLTDCGFTLLARPKEALSPRGINSSSDENRWGRGSGETKEEGEARTRRDEQRDKDDAAWLRKKP